jgi:hypothetical protein
LTDTKLSPFFTQEGAVSEVFMILNSYENGIKITSLFWGLWLFPFGYLVFKSGFLPKILGILLMLGCIGYCINIFGRLLVDDYTKIGIAKFFSIPASLGEIGIGLWMLVTGGQWNKLKKT